MVGALQLTGCALVLCHFGTSCFSGLAGGYLLRSPRPLGCSSVRLRAEVFTSACCEHLPQVSSGTISPTHFEAARRSRVVSHISAQYKGVPYGSS
jgi:hypothetical protein